MDFNFDCFCVVMILALPWYPVSKLQLPWRRKVSVLGIFALGAIVVAASITRVMALKNSTAGSDIDPTCEYNAKRTRSIHQPTAHC